MGDVSHVIVVGNWRRHNGGVRNIIFVGKVSDYVIIEWLVTS